MRYDGSLDQGQEKGPDIEPSVVREQLGNGTAVTITHTRWWKDRGLRSLNMRLLAIFLTPLMIGYDGTLIGSLLSMPRWYRDLGLSPEDGSLVGLMGAGYAFGAMIAFPVFSWAADTFGRRLVIMLGDVIVLGAGSMLVASSSPVLLTEIAHPRQRSLLVAGYGSLFFVGSIVVAWVSFDSLYTPTEWSWRIPTLLQIIPPALQLPLTAMVPESPRWLVSQNRHEEARNMLVRFHANGRSDDGDEGVATEYAMIRRAIELDRRGTAGWLAWIRGPGNRRRLLLVVSCTVFGSWSGGSIINVYLSMALRKVGITSPAQQTGINGGLQVFNLCAALLGAGLADRLGRRPLFLASAVVMLLAMVGFTVATEQFVERAQPASGVALVVMVFLFQFGYDLGYAPLTPMYISEICAYHLRAKAMALHYFFMYAFSAVGLYANPVALQALSWRYYIVYVGILVFEVAFTYFMFPETKGYTLEEVSAIFDKGDSEFSRAHT
ncbi:hypothetical protein CkaCkLH20_09312 [Colletotrichum karsti]|uniref:Major facilitator superfamily (MFS) profile domain-containing protein n=1 Tax=Colletotrichum karsti TaxID=1095194 RepID=A0A9P6LEG7_9PEZI|nr:uncharacterized protein CkaCkLH20_09312 [Colletotrichum karsti]KAF9873149.1 hypothetical protein CkaCkLH20_09312 [Colletotrichum karsti]